MMSLLSRAWLPHFLHDLLTSVCPSFLTSTGGQSSSQIPGPVRTITQGGAYNWVWLIARTQNGHNFKDSYFTSFLHY